MLTIFKDMILFDPNINYQKKLSEIDQDQQEEIQHKRNQKIDRIQKLALRVELKHLLSAKLYIENDENQFRISYIKREKDYILQIFLSDVGSRSIRERYQDKLKRLRQDKKPIAIIQFRISDYDFNEIELTEEQKEQHILDLVSDLNSKVESILEEEEAMALIQDSDFLNEEDSEEEILTKIPYFEIIKSSLALEKQDFSNASLLNLQFNEFQEEKTESHTGFLPKMLSKSNILNQDKFFSILSNIPPIFKCTNWDRVYSNMEDGFSFQTFLRLCLDEAPCFLIIQDVDKKVFGVYISDQIKVSSKFYGTGETFLFSFNNPK